MKFRKRVYLHPAGNDCLILRVLSAAAAEALVRAGVAEPVGPGRGKVRAVRLTGRPAPEAGPWARVVRQELEAVNARVWAHRVFEDGRSRVV